VVLPNCDFDTGKPAKPAEYSLTDEAYAGLLSRLSERSFALTSLQLRSDILNFYSDLSLYSKRTGPGEMAEPARS